MDAEEKRTESASAETNTTTHSRVDMHAPDGDINVVDSKIAGRDIVEVINQYHEIIIRVDNFEDQPPVAGEPPYKGMAYYTEQDKDNYFGREQLSDHLAARLQTTHFLALIGASGSGKSSLMRAGIIPRLRARNWRIHVIKPGTQPLTALAATLVPDAAAPAAIKALRSALAEDPETLQLAASQRVAQANADRLLLAIDQFEELFTQCKDERERAAFVANLVHAAGAQSAITVLPSLRADFYDRVSEFPALTDLVSQQQEYVKPMAQEDLVRVIFEPAQRGGWQLVDGLVEQILDDVGHEPGRLPLLSHALLETWERRRGVVMTLGGYRAAGGVEGAIAHTADATLAHMSTEQQAIARDIFLSLTELGEGAEDTRRVASLTELEAGKDAAAVANVLEMLVRARLITTDAGEVEVAHEALIRRWPRLKDEWLPDNRERLRFERQLAHDAAIWRDELDEDEDALYRGARLAQALELVAAGTLKPTVRSMAFLKASRELAQRHEREREAQQQRQLEQEQALAEAQRKRAEEAEVAAGRLRRRLYYVAGALVVAAIATLIAIIFSINAANSEAKAIAAEQTAQVDSARAIAGEATATVAQGQAETNAEEARVQQAEAERQSKLALAQSLAALAPPQAENVFSQDDELATLLALESLRLNKQHQGKIEWLVDQSLRSTLTQSNFSAILHGHKDLVLSVAFSPDGVWLASSGDDQTVRLWQVTDPDAPPLVLRGHEFVVRSVAFSPDGVWLASGSDDHTVRLWQVADPDAPPLILSSHESGVSSVAFSPDGTWLASGSADQTVRLWHLADPVTQPLVLRGHKDLVQSVAFSPDGTWLASGSDDQTVHLWQVADPDAPPLVLRGHEDWVSSVAFSPDGAWLASGSADQTVRLWQIADPDALPLVLHGHDDWVLSVAFSPDGAWLASGSADQTVRLWQVADPDAPPVVLRGHEDWVLSVAFSPDGAWLASGSADQTVRLWRMADPDAPPLVLRGHESWVLSVAFSPDGAWLASGSYDQTMRLWQIADPDALSLVLRDHESGVRSVAFSPDGAWLVSGSDDQTVRLWQMSDPTAEPLVLRGHEDWVLTVVFSPDGAWLASGSADQTVRLWQMTDPVAPQLVLHGHETWVESVAFSPDGAWLASGSDDQTVRLWQMSDPTAEPLALRGHEDFVQSVAFSPDGTWLTSGSNDGTVRLWLPWLWQLKEIGCQMVRRNLSWDEWQRYLPNEPYHQTCPNRSVHPTVPDSARPET
ncbi:MAG: hypothetical protein M9965_12215 [Anaerolineae bacterium]|nr:hypothetical protein [Anaerolineae bacterium]